MIGKLIIILIFSLISQLAQAVNFNCYTECRFFKPACNKKEKNRTLSDDPKNPSKIYTDINIYCDVEGTVKKDGKYIYKLLATGGKTDLTIIREKILKLSQGESIQPNLKFNNFTFSNPYKNQKIKVEFNSKSKIFYFDGIQVH